MTYSVSVQTDLFVQNQEKINFHLIVISMTFISMAKIYKPFYSKFYEPKYFFLQCVSFIRSKVAFTQDNFFLKRAKVFELLTICNIEICENT